MDQSPSSSSDLTSLLQAEKLNTYRFCDNVWTFMLKEVEFRENSELAKVDRVKIVACDAKSSVPARTARSTPRYRVRSRQCGIRMIMLSMVHIVQQWCTAHCTLHTAHCTLHTAHCTLHTAHCTV